MEFRRKGSLQCVRRQVHGKVGKCSIVNAWIRVTKEDKGLFVVLLCQVDGKLGILQQALCGDGQARDKIRQ